MPGSLKDLLAGFAAKNPAETGQTEKRHLEMAVAGLLHEMMRADSKEKAEERSAMSMALVEHLWRVAFADSELDPYEDHFVRKIAHLLYVPNTDAMLARQRARKR